MNNNATYDVAIIGGGLAGLSLAVLLRHDGYNVLVLEKDDYPRHKVCGEYISMESRPFLEGLGLPVSTMHLPAISKLLVTDVKGYKVAAALPQGGFGISRYMLDNALAAIARKEGVDVLVKTRADEVQYENRMFTIAAGKDIFTAKAVCGTWGKRSNMDVKWHRPFIQEQKKGLNNYIGVKYHIQYAWNDDLIALHNFTNGYCGISRIEDDKCCLCYLTTAANLKKSGNDIKSMESDILMRNPYLKEIFSGAVFLYQQPLTISQISFQKKEQVHDHILLLGDAAGLITPLCGNGMSMAFHAAKLARNVVKQYLKGEVSLGSMEEDYKKQWNKIFSNRLAAGRLLQANFGKDVATSLFLRSVHYLPFLKKSLINATSGKPF